MSAGRALRIWLIVALVASVFAVARPPLDQLGYDLSVAMAVLIALALPHIAALRAADYRRSKDARRMGPLGFVMTFFSQMVMAGIVLLFIPVAVVMVRGLFVGHCDLGTGLAWTFAIPGVSVLYAASIGVLFGLTFRSAALSTIASHLFIAATIVLAVRHLVADPPVFFYNGILGYISGPIYDERVTMSPALVWARAGTLVWTGVLLALAAATVNTRRTQLEPIQFLVVDFSLDNLLPRTGVVVGLVTLLALHVSRQETGVAPTADSVQAALGGREESEHFIIYYAADTSDSTDVALLVEDHEFRLAEILHALEIDTYPLDEKIESYLYPDPGTKKRLMGARRTSYADPFDLAMHLNASEFPHPVLKHELTHIVSSAYAGWLGFNLRIGIHEGLAVAVDWEEEDLTPHEWSAVMHRESLLPELSSVTSTLAFWRAPAARAYLATGSFIRHLLETHGPVSVLAFFGDGDYETHFGQPLEELEAGWHRALGGVSVTPEASALALARLERGAIFDRRCPRRIAELLSSASAAYAAGRHEHALERYERALALSPSESSARVGKLRTLVAMGRSDDAEAFGRTLLADGDGPTVGVAHEILGDMAWRAGDRDRARAHYTAVAESGAHAWVTRASEAKLAVLDEPSYVPVLVGSGGEAEDVAALKSLSVFGPHRQLASYLLGRRLFAEGADRAAVTHLGDASAALLPSPSLKAESLRLLGTARYRLGDDAGAAAAFEELAELRRTGAERARALAWVHRTRWRRNLPFASRVEEPDDADPEGNGEGRVATEVVAEADGQVSPAGVSSRTPTP